MVPTAAAGTDPVVSVLMPVRDAAGTLDAAIASVRAQTETAWELVAVDDGSTDGSLAALRAHAAREPRLRVLPAPRHGLVAALTAALAHARAPLLARMDADDLMRPERLARQRAHLDARPAVGLVATRVEFGGDRARAAGYARYVDWTNGLLTHAELRLGAFVDAPFAHPTVMFRRAIVDRLGGYADGDFPEDYELWLRWLDGGVRMEKLPEALLVWHDAPGRLSRRDPRYRADAFERVRARYLARWLAATNPRHPAVTVWGAGREGRRRARALAAHGVRVTAWIDVDPRKIGRTLHGAPVVSPEALPPPGERFVVSVVGSHGARELIAAQLEARGYRAGADYVVTA